MKYPHVELGERYAKDVHVSGIYSLVNKTNGKQYIGSAVSLRNRLSAHFRALARGAHCNSKLQRAYVKYGAADFCAQVVLVCEKADLIFYEQLCIDAYGVIQAGYNLAPTAGSCLGVKCSPEKAMKISASKTGKKVPLLSAVMMGKKNALGYKRTPEQIERSVAPQRGVPKGPASLQSRINQAAAQRGKKHSDERRRRSSEQRKGIKLGPMSSEHKSIRSLALIGRPWSAARRIAHVKQTEESRAKRIKGQAKRRLREQGLLG